MFDITKFAIENRRVTQTVMLLIVVLGALAFGRLPKAEDPGFVVRKARVVTYFPGASPERMEQLVSDKLEKAIQEMPELEYVRSESTTGKSVITVKIWDRYRNMRPIWDTLRRKMEKTSRELPKGVDGPFVNDEFGDVFGTILTVSGKAFSYRELKTYADEVRDQLLFLDEVAKVDVYGAQEERIFIEYDDSRLAELGASSLQLKAYLDHRNIITPGGSITTPKERVVVEPTGNFESLEDLRNLIVRFPGHDEVSYMKDLATVSRGYIDPPVSLMRCDGKSCVGLGISLRERGDVSKLGEEVQALVARLQTTYPLGLHLDFVAQEFEEVTTRVNTFLQNLFQSVTLVMVIMLVSLGFRTGFVVAGLIPMTILLTFFVMSLLDIGIDQISLASLIIALGMLVDNAIVMSESIFTKVSKGKDPKQAAIDSAKELRGSLLTSSLTTSVAFLPIFLAKSLAGEYMASLFKVVTIALLSSWVLSLTFIPLLCVTFLQVKKNADHANEGIYLWYKKTLEHLLQRPWRQLGWFGVVLVVSMGAFTFVPKTFFPTSDRANFNIKYQLPVGTRIETTEQIVQQIEGHFLQSLMGKEGVVNWATFIGGVTPRYILNQNPTPLGPEEAFMIVNTTSAQKIPELMLEIEKYVVTTFPEVRITLESITYGPPVAAPVAFRISGQNNEELFANATIVKQALAKVPGTKNIRDDWRENSKKLVVNVNQPRALRAGITNLDVAISLQTMLSGFETTQFREADEVIPVTLRSVSDDREHIDKLETLNIFSQRTAASVPLRQIADLSLRWQPNNILRRDRLRTVTVMADLDPGYNAQKIANNMKPWLDGEAKQWKLGSFYEIGGEKESSEISRNSIVEQLPLAALLIVLLLVSQFNSFRQALIILMTIPMGIIGVIAGMIVTGTSFDFMAFLGVISLSGIVVNDAIVLIERINLERTKGLPLVGAVLEAAQRRMRPILLTTYTTIGGMLPLWLWGGELFKPMAIAVIFGLVFATALTLGFVPILYTLFYRCSRQKRVFRLNKRKR